MTTHFGKIPTFVGKRFDGEFELPWDELVVDEAGHLAAGPSSMDFVVDRDERGVYFEYYVTNRFVWGDIHERIYASGEHVDNLETIQPVIITKPGEDPEEKRREYDEHNRAVAQNLREAGVFPEHDINAQLRTNPELRDDGARGLANWLRRRERLND